MNIGEQIYQLRKKNNMTQENLAELLHVSCQAVSKWERGISSPDLSLIEPLTKIFNISADDLLGITDNIAKNKYSKYNEAYKKYRFNQDYSAGYWWAKEAVTEYPHNYMYIEWLANSEYNMAFIENLQSEANIEYFDELTESALRHYEIVIENCPDTDIVSLAVLGKIVCLRFLERIEEAEWCVEFEYPDINVKTLEQALILCNEGIELLKYLETE